MNITNIEEYVKDLTDKVSLVDGLFEDTVLAYSGNLDTLMKEIQTNLLEVDLVPISTIERYFTALSSEVYFVSAKLEKLGLFDSLSKAKAQETYNTKYLEYQQTKTDGKKPTVAEITANAETASLYDTTLSDVYNKAYKTLKNKISAAETMISTLSKILSHRMQESQLTTQQTERQILNESNIF